VSVLETVLIFVAAPAGLYLLIALLAAAPGFSRRQRWRVGQPWPHRPLFWTANPEGARLPPPSAGPAVTEHGGARGSW
jgi:hypothetical protein